jgi:cytochrome P450
MVDLTPLTAPTAEDPYAYYARLALDAPFVFAGELNAWLAASAAAVETVLNNAAFRVRPVDDVVPSIMRSTALGELFAHMVRMTDGPLHAPRRHEAEQLLEGIDVPAIASALPDLRTAPLDALMFAFPSRAVATLLGITPRDVEGIEVAARALARAIAPGATPETVAPGSRAVEALNAIFAERFPDEQRRYGAMGLLFQAYDGTAGLIGNTLYHLAIVAPVIASRIVQDAPTLAGFVAEVARLDPPVHNTRRFAATEIAIDDAIVRENESVLVLLAAANADSAAAGRTFTFGAGAHACIAARLAITIASVAIKALVSAGIDFASIKRDGFYPALNVRVPRLSYAPLR